MFGFLFAKKRPASPARASFRPQLEVLEGRALMSAMPLLPLPALPNVAAVRGLNEKPTPPALQNQAAALENQAAQARPNQAQALQNQPTQVNTQVNIRPITVQLVQTVPVFQNNNQVHFNQVQATNNNLKPDMEKALITKGPMTLRNGPVGSAPKTQREQEREALDRMLALPVTRPPADGIQAHEIRPRFRTGSETGERPAAPPKGWRKIEVFGPPEGNSTLAVKKGTFYQDPESGRMIRWS
jgi:hypothetical protein